MSDNIRTIGSVARHLKRHVIDAMMKGDVPCESPRLWGVLQSAAHEARCRGVTISLITRGFICQVEGKAEIVTWEQADLGVLHRAIDRLVPLPEEDAA